MTDTYIPQTSSSDRYEAARKALADYERDGDGKPWLYDTEKDDSAALALALRALITPPGVGESVEQIASNVMLRLADSEPFVAAGISKANLTRHVRTLVAEAVRAGIQNAHETWECEDRPTQEQMLRWLGIEYEDTDGTLYIEPQCIDREEI